MFRVLPPFGGDQRATAEVVNGIMNGKTNNTGTVTLRQSQVTTVITDERIGYESVILFMPVTSDAADEMSHGHMYVSSRGKGTATISHGNHNSVMTYAYVVIG
jgi:hypothetical protein